MVSILAKLCDDSISEFSIKHPLDKSWVMWFDYPPAGGIQQHNWLDSLNKVRRFCAVLDRVDISVAQSDVRADLHHLVCRGLLGRVQQHCRRQHCPPGLHIPLLQGSPLALCPGQPFSSCRPASTPRGRTTTTSWAASGSSACPQRTWLPPGRTRCVAVAVCTYVA